MVCEGRSVGEPALAAVRDGKTKFIPENWQKTYFQWLENIQPWCISRQLWWGHQIPAWYGLKKRGLMNCWIRTEDLRCGHEEEAIDLAEQITVRTSLTIHPR